MKLPQHAEFLKNQDYVLYMSNWGSINYGVTNLLSDNDFIVVVNEDYKLTTNDCVIDNDNYCMYSLSKFNEMIKNNHVVAVETAFLDNKNIFINKINHNSETLKIDLLELRKSFSATISNAWDKGRKKLEKTNEFYIGKKSLWHSLRILMFGIQICQYGKIMDYTEANLFYDKIVLNDCNDWEYYKIRYTELMKYLEHKFKMYTNDVWQEYKVKEKQ